MSEKPKDQISHLVVSENIHAAVRSVAAENKIDMIDFVDKILKNEPHIKAALNRIARK